MDKFSKAIEQAKKALLDAFEFTALVDEAIDKHDLAEVVHGEWIPTGKSLAYCSNCKNCALRERTGGMFYCPNCGAKMDRKDQNDE